MPPHLRWPPQIVNNGPGSLVLSSREAIADVGMCVGPGKPWGEPFSNDVLGGEAADDVTTVD